MSIEGLGLSQDLVDLLTNKWGIKELYPPQQKALPAALSGKNIMLTIPTASGKSLVAHLTICLLYTSPSPRDVEESRMPSSA